VTTKPRTPFRDIATAPRNGALIEVRHGPNQEAVLARWSGQNQAFVAADDPLRRTLHRVTSWRPATEAEAPARAEQQLTIPPIGEAMATQAAVLAVPRSRIVTARKPRTRR
jgi:hypothetical protein